VVHELEQIPTPSECGHHLLQIVTKLGQGADAAAEEVGWTAADLSRYPPPTSGTNLPRWTVLFMRRSLPSTMTPPRRWKKPKKSEDKKPKVKGPVHTLLYQRRR